MATGTICFGLWALVTVKEVWGADQRNPERHKSVRTREGTWQRGQVRVAWFAWALLDKFIVTCNAQTCSSSANWWGAIQGRYQTGALTPWMNNTEFRVTHGNYLQSCCITTSALALSLSPPPWWSGVRTSFLLPYLKKQNSFYSKSA
jgi:hypothetical protein